MKKIDPTVPQEFQDNWSNDSYTHNDYECEDDDSRWISNFAVN